MRRKIGIAGLTQDSLHKERLQRQAEEIQELKVSQVQEQLEIFRSKLELFASKYKKNINKDPLFRRQFNELCGTIGVDPLISCKGFWGQLLGVGDFYYELAVQIVEVCMQTRPVNGGVIDIEVLLSTLQKKKAQTISRNVTIEDIERAVNKLAVLGNGFTLLRIGERKMLQSVPCELIADHTTVMSQAQDGYVTISLLKTKLGWSPDRINLVISFLLSEGMVWIDNQDEGGELFYWFPGIQVV